MGVGAARSRRSLACSHAQTGGGQERGRRARTENLPGIVGFGVAATLAGEFARHVYSRIAELRDLARSWLSSPSRRDAHIHGP